VAEKKFKKRASAVTPEELDEVFASVALSALRRHEDGLAAAMVCCNALGLDLPDWVRDTLATEQFLTTFSGARRRQKQTRAKMELFAKDLLRYWVIPRPGGRHQDKFERAFQEVEGLWFAPRDASGLRKSFYKFKRLFGSHALARFVADRVITAWMKQYPLETVPPSGTT
jgi:hypothetical protein